MPVYDDVDHEAEMLQTDIMRFMAILGFILMGIFSLVGSLPVTTETISPLLEERDALVRDVAALDAYAKTQLVLLRQIQAEILHATEIRDALTHPKITRASPLAQALDDSRSIHSDLTSSQRRLEEVEAQLARKSQSLSLLRSRVEKERQKLERTEVRVRELTKPAEGAPAVSPPLPPAKPASTVPRAGFVLKFASDAAFNRLLAERTIRFYAMVGTMAWRASRSDSRAIFKTAKRPQTYYEMAASTVPGDYPRSLRRIVAAPGVETITWGVVLPARITGEVQRRISGKRGADVVIQADGSVHLEHVQP